MSVSNKFRLLLNSVGENSKLLEGQNTAYIAVDGQVLLSKQAISGVKIEIKEYHCRDYRNKSHAGD